MFDFVNKLQYYPDKTKAFLDGDYSKTLSTVMLYLAANICNHNCIYCDKNFYEISYKQFEREYLDKLVDDMVLMGADSLIILGEGAEPLLSKELCHLIGNASNHGIACGIYTNGSVVNSDIVNAFNHLDFVRVSLDAGTSKTHKLIHQYDSTKDYFTSAIKLLQSVDKEKVDTGISFIILNENIHEIFDTWKLMSYLGVGYIELKLPLAKGYVFDSVTDGFIQEIKEQLCLIRKENSSGSKIVLNRHLDMLLNGEYEDSSILTVQEEVNCYTSVFRTIISPLGYFVCSPKKNLNEAKYGDPFKQSLYDAWNSKQHWEMIGNPCSICCTYCQQNLVLNEMKMGKQRNTFGKALDEQKHFL